MVGRRAAQWPPSGSSARIALAACAAVRGGLGGEDLLREALADRRVEATWVAWDDPDVDWAAFDAVVLRATWDYPGRVDEFQAWVRQVAIEAALVNPANLVLGNLHKSYLADMGADAVPTVVVPVGMTVDLGQLRWRHLVVKPAVAVGGHGAVRHATQADLDALTLADEGAVDAVVQPYLAGVEGVGETSVVCIGGEPSHAVRKLPAAGEFRIHEHHGGTVEPIPLAAADVAAARRALARLPARPPYARVHLLRDGDRPLVVELELVEPYLYLEHAPGAAGRLADALLAHLGAAVG